jgi:site-specific DNA-methyltransferase (adenine-specific)
MKMAEKVVIGNAELWHGDCMEILPTLGKVDAVITDPPYGIGMDGGNVGYKGFNDFEKLGWDRETPSEEAIRHVLAAGAKAILWGGNYFNLPPSRCWLVWDKGAGFKNRSYAEAELAWASFDANVRVFTYDPLARGDYKGKHHPTMKPVALMKWCIEHAGNSGTVLDPYMGSGTTGVAAIQMGRSFIGIERERAYFDIACRRIEQAQAQGTLLPPEPPRECVQEGLL